MSCSKPTLKRSLSASSECDRAAKQSRGTDGQRVSVSDDRFVLIMFGTAASPEFGAHLVHESLVDVTKLSFVKDGAMDFETSFETYEYVRRLIALPSTRHFSGYLGGCSSALADVVITHICVTPAEYNE